MAAAEATRNAVGFAQGAPCARSWSCTRRCAGERTPCQAATRGDELTLNGDSPKSGGIAARHRPRNGRSTNPRSDNSRRCPRCFRRRPQSNREHLACSPERCEPARGGPDSATSNSIFASTRSTRGKPPLKRDGGHSIPKLSSASSTGGKRWMRHWRRFKTAGTPLRRSWSRLSPSVRHRMSSGRLR